MRERKPIREIRIKVFNIGWWFYVILTVVMLGIISVFLRQYPEDVRLKMILYLSIIEYIILRFYKYSLKDIRDDYSWYNEWPCYLCNQSTIMCILACLLNSQIIMSFCVTVGTMGALLAVFMPDRYNRDQLLFSKQAFGFYGYHGLLITTCLLFYTAGLYEAKPVHCLWGMFFTFLLASLGHIINIILRKTGLNEHANYVFTCEPDNEVMEKMYQMIPIRLVYLTPIMLGFGIVSFIALLIM